MNITRSKTAVYCARVFYCASQVGRSFSCISRGASRSARVKQSDRFSVHDITALSIGKLDLLRIPNFCSDKAIDCALEKLRETPVEDYQNAQGVGRFRDMGMAYFEVENPKQLEKYYKQAIPAIEKVRALFDPYQSPIDKVRLFLDEQWKHGASLLRLHQEPMYAGLIRAIASEILPHEDKLERDDPSALTKINYNSQVAFNCYLAVPNKGGALELWDFDLTTAEYDQLRGDSYGIDRALLPPPFITAQPEKGEFMAFNGRRLHAVTANLSPNQVRISLSGFALFQGSDAPLHIWS